MWRLVKYVSLLTTQWEVVYILSLKNDSELARYNSGQPDTSSSVFAALRQIRSVRRSLTSTTLLTLVHALVVTKVDYCSSILLGISGQLLRRLQSVFNAAARLVFPARKSEHVTPLLRELH